MTKLAYFPLLMDRWIAGTQELSFEERGFYISLLVYLYDTGKPIKDSDHAARILRCDKRTSRRLWAKLLPKFRLTSGGIRHRLCDELLRNGGKIKTLEGNRFPLKPDPDPEKEKDSPSESPKRKCEPRGCRLPEEWQPDDQLRRWAARQVPGLDLAIETAKFRDYWQGASGQRATKRDWPATWRNWIRKAYEQKTKHNGRKTFDDIASELERMGCEDTGEILEGDGGNVRATVVRGVWQ